MKLTTTTMVSIDGVTQGLGTPDEDRRGGFERGGWVAPLFDEQAATQLGAIYSRAGAFLFGRWTYEVFASSWGAMEEIPSDNPVAVALNTKPKYVASSTLVSPKWMSTSVLSGDVEAAVREVKSQSGDELQVHGSGKFIRWLLDRSLVDEMNLITFPVVLGQGTHLFPQTGPDLALDLVQSSTTPGGAIFNVYRPAGRPQYEAPTSDSTMVKN